MTTYDSVKVELKVDGNTFHHQSIITDVTTTEVILGLDFLEQKECLIDTAKKTLQFGDQGPVVTLTHSSVRESIVAEVDLTMDRSLQLLAYSAMEVMVKTPGGVAGKT